MLHKQWFALGQATEKEAHRDLELQKAFADAVTDLGLKWWPPLSHIQYAPGSVAPSMSALK